MDLSPKFVTSSDPPVGGIHWLAGASTIGTAQSSLSLEQQGVPICHPGTRQDCIERLVQRCMNTDQHAECIIWAKGPLGVGKSAIARCCAEALDREGKLGASFFFSRNQSDPSRFFPSIAYQLTTRFTSYREFLGNTTFRDQDSFFRKPLSHQFYNLFIRPFTESNIKEEVAGQVIVVDGLDGCDGREAQTCIIEIIAQFIRAGTNPFLWIFFSRLEPWFVTVFNKQEIGTVTQHVELPISRDIDPQILVYLEAKLQDIGREHGINLPWPSETELLALVDISAGLFLCAHAIVDFIAERSIMEKPEHKLELVLQLPQHSATGSHGHPLSALGEAYVLALERLPPSELQVIQWFLLTTHLLKTNYAYKSANLLHLTRWEFQNASQPLHSVMTLEDGQIRFYHPSFMEFLENPARSGKFCIWSDCAVTLLEEVLRHLDRVHVDIDTKGRYIPLLHVTWPGDWDQTPHRCYTDHVLIFFKILSNIRLGIDRHIHSTLMRFDFRKLCFEWYWKSPFPTNAEMELLMRNLDLISVKPRLPRIFGRWRASVNESTSRYYILGEGEKRAQVVVDEIKGVWFEAYSRQVFENWTKQLYQIRNIE